MSCCLNYVTIRRASLFVVDFSWIYFAICKFFCCFFFKYSSLSMWIPVSILHRVGRLLYSQEFYLNSQNILNGFDYNSIETLSPFITSLSQLWIIVVCCFVLYLTLKFLRITNNSLALSGFMNNLLSFIDASQSLHTKK